MNIKIIISTLFSILYRHKWYSKILSISANMTEVYRNHSIININGEEYIIF